MTSTLDQKLNRLAQKKQQILQERKVEIGNIFDAFGGLELKDELIKGFLHIATNHSNDTYTIKQLETIGAKKRRPKKTKLST